jgi:hypothetical protein
MSNGVKFDFFGDGKPLQMAWTAIDSRNAFLVLDRNANGTIDNGSELFGNVTPQPDSTHKNGFAALAEFDKPENGGDANGVIDARDEGFSHLRLWIDENHDGVSQPGELHTLPELGVTSLSLAYEELGRKDRFGNRFRYRAAVNPVSPTGKPVDGRWAYDVFLTVTDKPANNVHPSTEEAINPFP